MQHPPEHIFDHTPESLKDWCADRGLKPFRAKQILEWVYQHNTIDPAAMSNLSASDRGMLAAEMVFESCTTLAHQKASDGTQKLLVQWDEGPGNGERQPGTPIPLTQITPDPSRQTECVMIPTETRKTACISSQVGCPVGCRFCASGLGGLDGNLSAGRIIEQIWRLNQLPEVGRITNIVFMGMGEPLANLPAVVHATKTITADWGLGISARKVTISTVGMPKAIENLAEQLDLPVTLALSLHAPNDELRRELIPWAEYSTIEELLSACQAWFKKTGREITLEYILLGGVNDQPEHARQLAALAQTLRSNINLIRYNEVDGLDFKRPLSDDVLEFQRILKAEGANVHIRASRGRDIAAACGQLRHEQQTV